MVCSKSTKLSPQSLSPIPCVLQKIPSGSGGTGLEHHDAGAVGAGIHQQRSGFWMFSNRNAIGIDPRISQIIPKYPKIIPESSRISGSRGIGLSRHVNFGKKQLAGHGFSWHLFKGHSVFTEGAHRKLPIPVFFRDDLNISHGDSAGKQCAKLVGHQLFFSHSLPVTMDFGQDSAKINIRLKNRRLLSVE